MFKKILLSAVAVSLFAGCSQISKYLDGEALVKGLVEKYFKEHPDALKLKEDELEGKVNTWVNEKIKQELSKLALGKPKEAKKAGEKTEVKKAEKSEVKQKAEHSEVKSKTEHSEVKK